MPIRKTNFLKGKYYHLFNRGDRKEIVFQRHQDYQRFLEKIEEYRQKYRVSVVCYCLIPNHFHLLVKQLSDLSLSQFMGTLLNSYSRYASVRYELPPGHVFQGRFGAKNLESEADLLQTSRYIHLNPVKEKILEWANRESKRFPGKKEILKRLREFRWSSYGIYLGKFRGPVEIYKEEIFRSESPGSYRHFVEAKLTGEERLALESF